MLKAPDGGSELSITPEIRALASGLADELFQRWELAMQQRFGEEIKLRLKSELEHREHRGAVLREEGDQRARGAFGPGGTKVVGMADPHATWERDRKLINQSRDVAEMERQMAEMRERLRELGADPDDSTVTVRIRRLQKPREKPSGTTTLSSTDSLSADEARNTLGLRDPIAGRLSCGLGALPALCSA